MTNNGKTTVIGQYTVTEAAAEEQPEITELTPNTGESGKATTVKALISTTKTRLTYATDFAVSIGGEAAKVSYKGTSYFSFKTPTTLSAGTYDVEMTNNGKTTVIGQYTVTAK